MIPRNKRYRAVGKALPPDKPHNVASRLWPWSKRDVNMDEGLLQLISTSRRRSLPIYWDIQFRLSFCILPVRARFWVYNNHIQKSPCALTRIVVEWKATNKIFLSIAGRVQFEKSSFRRGQLFFCLTTIVTHRVCMGSCTLGCVEPFRLVEKLWFTLVAVAIYFVCMERNRRFLAHATSTPTAPAVSAIYSTLSAHIRYFQRQRNVKE